MLRAKEELMGILYGYLEKNGWKWVVGGMTRKNARIWVEPEAAGIRLRIATKDMVVETRISSKNVADEIDGTLYIAGSYEKIAKGEAKYIIREGKEFKLNGVIVRLQD